MVSKTRYNYLVDNMQTIYVDDSSTRGVSIQNNASIVQLIRSRVSKFSEMFKRKMFWKNWEGIDEVS